MKITVSIIGGGPSALALACFLNEALFDVSIYEKNKALGRKFLVAGDGGFNLSHSENMNDFITRYTPSHFIKESLLHFTNKDLQSWFKNLGVPTFIGSSSRIYPEKGIKPIKVLNVIKEELYKRNTTILLNEEWTGWNEKNYLTFKSGREINTDITVFCLGGGSWKVTGSNDKWLKLFSEKGIKTKHFEPSNCAFQTQWDDNFINKNSGKPLKNISITSDNKTQKGEVVITKLGLEGNAIYALSPQIREQLKTGKAIVYIDHKPTLSEDIILKKLSDSSFRKVTESLKKDLKLSPTQIDLIKNVSTKEQFLDHTLLSKLIKNCKLEITACAPLDEAISTVGGINLDEVDKQFQLKKLRHNYCLGEMLDFDAPTGGYLLQACFSSGVFLANTLNNINKKQLHTTSKNKRS